MAVKHFDLDIFQSSCYPADSAFLSLHLVVAALVATMNVVFLSGQALGRIDNSLLKASLALDQPYFTGRFGYIRAIVGL
jgi:hypothetical protein